VIPSRPNRTCSFRDQLTAWIAAVRIAVGAIWAIDASLKWQPGFRDAVPAGSVDRGQPH
jgi:hypothetical protein